MMIVGMLLTVIVRWAQAHLLRWQAQYETNT
jgi:hypothetical protein